jgi:hypothetical protein
MESKKHKYAREMTRPVRFGSVCLAFQATSETEIQRILV